MEDLEAINWAPGEREWGVEKASPHIRVVRIIKSRRLRWAGHVARMEVSRSAFKILTDKPTGKRLLGRPRRR